MKLGEVVFAAVYKDGDIAEDYESHVIGTKEYCKLSINSCLKLKDDSAKGLVEIKPVVITLYLK